LRYRHEKSFSIIMTHLSDSRGSRGSRDDQIKSNHFHCKIGFPEPDSVSSSTSKAIHSSPAGGQSAPAKPKVESQVSFPTRMTSAFDYHNAPSCFDNIGGGLCPDIAFSAEIAEQRPQKGLTNPILF
jgi:hypothetical protein